MGSSFLRDHADHDRPLYPTQGRPTVGGGTCYRTSIGATRKSPFRPPGTSRHPSFSSSFQPSPSTGRPSPDLGARTNATLKSAAIRAPFVAVRTPHSALSVSVGYTVPASP